MERQRRWDMGSTLTNPGCLFVPSPSSTSPFCATVPHFSNNTALPEKYQALEPMPLFLFQI